MRSLAQMTQHPAGIGRIKRLAQQRALVVDDNCVGREDQRGSAVKRLRHRFRLLPAEPLGIIHQRFIKAGAIRRCPA